jgi:hypothetical protein
MHGVSIATGGHVVLIRRIRMRAGPRRAKHRWKELDFVESL